MEALFTAPTGLSDDAQSESESKAVEKWWRGSQTRFDELVTTTVDSAPVGFIGPLRRRVRQNLVQTTCDILSRLLRQMLDPQILRIVNGLSHPFPDSLLNDEQDRSFATEVDAMLSWKNSPTPDAEFEAWVHPWTRQDRWSSVRTVVWAGVVGARFTMYYEPADRLFSEKLLHILGDLRNSFETDVLPPMILNRVQAFLPWKDVAALVRSYVLDPEYNCYTRRSAADLLQRSKNIGTDMASTIATWKADVQEIELAMERLHDWLKDLLREWDQHVVQNRPTIGREAFTVMARWSRTRTKPDPNSAITVSGLTNEDLRLRALSTPLHTVEWSSVMKWRFGASYPFVFRREKFEKAFKRLFHYGSVRKKLVVFDVMNTLVEEGHPAPDDCSPDVARDHAELVMQELTDRGILMAGVSDNVQARDYVDCLGWLHYFATVQTTNCATSKHAMFSEVSQLICVPIANWVVFSTRQQDVDDAAAMGAQSRLVNPERGITLDDIIAMHLIPAPELPHFLHKHRDHVTAPPMIA